MKKKKSRKKKKTKSEKIKLEDLIKEVSKKIKEKTKSETFEINNFSLDLREEKMPDLTLVAEIQNTMNPETLETPEPVRMSEIKEDELNYKSVMEYSGINKPIEISIRKFIDHETLRPDTIWNINRDVLPEIFPAIDIMKIPSRQQESQIKIPTKNYIGREDLSFLQGDKFKKYKKKII